MIPFFIGERLQHVWFHALRHPISGMYRLDDFGEPESCSAEEANQWEAQHSRQIAEEYIGDVRVSTVFLGIDHNFGEGRPVLWETMIFNGPDEIDESQWRARSHDEALENHEEAILLVKAHRDNTTK